MRIKLLIYFVARAVGLFALCRLFTRSRIRILCYHGACLGDESSYNPLLFMTAETFRRRVDWLQTKGFKVISLERAVDALDNTIDAGRLPTVITFDDGWRSAATRLIPVLAEKGLPSTLYLHTGHFGKDWPVLGIVVDYMLWKANRPLINIVGLGAFIVGSYRVADAADRDRLVESSCRWLVSHPATRASITERIHRLAKSMGLDIDDIALASQRFDYLSYDELLQLSEQGCTVELHGHQHRYPEGDPEAFAADLVACREAILELGLPKPQHYCYPSGVFADEAEMTLNRLDIRSATTCVPGLIHPSRGVSRRYFLPRFLDGEHLSMLVFEAELSGFADVLRHAFGR